MDNHVLIYGYGRVRKQAVQQLRAHDKQFVVLEMNKKVKIISKAFESTSIKKLKIAGADDVIMPDSLGGTHMASLVVAPDVMEFPYHISIQESAHVNLEEISFNHLPEDIRYRSVGELNTYTLTGCIIGIKTSEGQYVINPSPQTYLTPDSKLFVLGDPDQINKLNKLLGV